MASLGNQVKFFIHGIPTRSWLFLQLGQYLPQTWLTESRCIRVCYLYTLGSDALGGAVNIVSRKNANYLDATYSIGSYNTHRFSINGAYTSHGGFTIRANAFANYSDNNYKVWAPIVNLSANKQEGYEWVKRFR